MEEEVKEEIVIVRERVSFPIDGLSCALGIYWLIFLFSFLLIACKQLRKENMNEPIAQRQKPSITGKETEKALETIMMSCLWSAFFLSFC